MIIEERRAFLDGADATASLGGRLAPRLCGGSIVTLSGDLGTGKTTMVRGMLSALGWAGPVKSPTYALVEHYRVSSLYFYHFDFYRLNDPDEWETGGFSDYFRADALCVIEWPERVQQFLPRVDLALSLEHAGTGRSVCAVAHTETGRECLAAIPQRTP